jgi:hypothetical protein
VKRDVTDVLRRGFDNTAANWPLIMLRVATQLVSTLIVVGSIILSVVPIVVSVGIHGVSDLKSPDQVMEVLTGILTSHWIALVIALVVVGVALLVVVMLLSFVDAGTSRIVIDGETRARTEQPQRAEFTAFSIDRWMAGGRKHWLPIFWIYNIAWTVAGIILLLPLTLTLIGILAIGESPAAIAVGCGGLAISLLFGVAIAIVTSLWSRKAIIVSVALNLRAVESLRVAWKEIRGDAARHVAVAFVLMAVAFGAAGIGGAVSFIGSSDHSGMLAIAFIPMQIALSILNGVISAAVATWGSASFASLTMEGRA